MPMEHHFDYNNLRTEEDIKIAQERLKHSVLLQEEILLKSCENLRTNFIINLKKSVLNLGMKIVTDIIINQIQTRVSKKC